tara:strand:+ start:107136 stop:107315 length:180 start_codon:yes stop_codon:yes gene_type:complete
LAVQPRRGQRQQAQPELALRPQVQALLRQESELAFEPLALASERPVLASEPLRLVPALG